MMLENDCEPSARGEHSMAGRIGIQLFPTADRWRLVQPLEGLISSHA